MSNDDLLNSVPSAERLFVLASGGRGEGLARSLQRAQTWRKIVVATGWQRRHNNSHHFSFEDFSRSPADAACELLLISISLRTRIPPSHRPGAVLDAIVLLYPGQADRPTSVYETPNVVTDWRRKKLADDSLQHPLA